MNISHHHCLGFIASSVSNGSFALLLFTYYCLVCSKSFIKYMEYFACLMMRKEELENGNTLSVFLQVSSVEQQYLRSFFFLFK